MALSPSLEKKFKFVLLPNSLAFVVFGYTILILGVALHMTNHSLLFYYYKIIV